jgi:GNAT superfamily N-acetyltransferase
MAYDGEVPVGAATCLPLEDAAVSYQAPFLARAWPVEKFFYLAEAVLLPEYRGRGIGAAFLAQRETHIRAVSDCEFACFCAIERPANHPARPSNWVPLNAFWRRHGYSPVRGFRSAMRWKEFGRNEESDLTMQVWVKSLGRAVLPAA